MSSLDSNVSSEALEQLCQELISNNRINPRDFEKYHVKRGLRNSDGTGVMAGLTRICNVHGYVVSDGERVPVDGQLFYRGIEINEIINGCNNEDRFGFEEVVWLLLFGTLPNSEQLRLFKNVLAESRELPKDFVEDMIMKAPSANVMNKIGRSVLALYSYDDNPDDLSIENVMSQCVQLIAQLPMIMTYAYQVKRRVFYRKSMYIHSMKKEFGTAENILRTIRSDKTFTDAEAKLLDTCLMLHAEHGGGNNSAFTSRVLTSAGADTYSAISASVGSLKGHKHGGANIKVQQMLKVIEDNVADWRNDDELSECLARIINKELGDGSGLIYGMGHAVYTMSDPRAQILKKNAREMAEKHNRLDELELIESIERLTPDVFSKVKNQSKVMCANVDLYSGFVYDLLGIPQDLFTPLFAVARIPGWCAHRMEELMTGGRIIRPAYKSVFPKRRYVPIDERIEHYSVSDVYIPQYERKNER